MASTFSMMIRTMYGLTYGWSRQSWLIDPRPTDAAYRAYNYQPGIFQKRELNLSGNYSSTGNDTDPSPNQDTTAADRVCHANIRPLGNYSDQLVESSDVDYNNFFFVDMDGNPIDSRKCSFIYEDDSKMHIVLDGHGKVVHVYTGDEDDDVWSTLNIPAMQTAGPVTQTAGLITISVTTGLAHVAGRAPRSMLPATTTWSTVSSGSMVTPAP
ncbi:hypothetical protein MGYG_09042 [Nannizzia gypsea CBS 118893]|uniref:Uncharacterized protein n=1 Tax=Arthroderma gypseum (strain ATCC MYA-4604 / CBS 118893) TaxID=535722 RepID=E4URQ2_ARTGP|nr:hypothetical protein MGYG_09042 [Nannizzia gypsea CBS 118893]EFR01174.1 hypothetical protein MGYG_09042 [Nannizzia gypsea CBS 118893]